MKQVLSNMMSKTRHQYLALRLEEQQIRQADGSTFPLALPGPSELDSAAEPLPLALPPVPEGSQQRHPSPSQGQHDHDVAVESITI